MPDEPATRVQVSVYHTPAAAADGWDSFYFCCEVCGNCGQRRVLLSTAAHDAAKHMEVHNG